MPPSSRGFFRPREKSLILLVLITFGFFCFGAIFFLPDRQMLDVGSSSGPNGNRVYKVYKELGEAGHEFILPPPPLGSEGGLDNPNVRHHVLDRPLPHKVDDKARLMAQIEMDLEMNKRKQQQQVRHGLSA